LLASVSKNVSENMNTIESIVLRELRQLPPSQHNEVLDFVQFLRRKSPNIPKKSVRGLCADLPFDLTDAFGCNHRL